MENEERINEYIKQCCSNCKNKSNCKIKVFETEDIIFIPNVKIISKKRN